MRITPRHCHERVIERVLMMKRLFYSWPLPLVLAASPAFAQDQAAKVDKLTALIGRALVESQESNAPPVPFALQVKNAIAANVGDAGWFVVRFVYLRRDCGPLHAPLLSAPTQRFQLASFFDSDEIGRAHV